MTDAHPQEELLSAWVDDALSPAKKEALDRHLAQCDRCRATVAQLQAVRDLLRDLPREPVPAGWRDGLMARVAEEEDAPPDGAAAPAGGAPWWSSRPGLLAGAAVVLLILVVGGLRLMGPLGAGSPAADEVAPLSQPFIAMERVETTDELVPESDAAGDPGVGGHALDAGRAQDAGNTQDGGANEILMAERQPGRRRVHFTVLATALTTLAVTVSLLIVVTRRRRSPPPA